jgi:GNAT superfamily N-acetyltransferase
MTIALAQTDADIVRCFPVVAQLRPHLIEAEFLPRIRRMQKEGFHLAFLEDRGAVRGVAGYRFFEKLLCGPHLYVDDLVTDETNRSRGYGARLLTWLKAEAQAHRCMQLELDSGVQRSEAHRFYFRERMRVSAFHFVVPLKT